LRDPPADEIHQVLANVSGAKPVRWRPFLGGKANTNLLVEFDSGEPVVLRYHEGDSDPWPEKAIADRLRPFVRTPIVFGVDEERRASVLEYLPFASLEEALEEGKPIDYFSIGNGLAKLRRVLFPHAGCLKPDLTCGLALGDPGRAYLDRALRFLSKPVCQRKLPENLRWTLKQELERELSELPAATGPFALVHSDFKANNLLIDEEGKLVALIDFTYSHAGDPLLDVGMFLRDPRVDLPGQRASFLHGLRHGGVELGRVELQRSRLFDLANLLDFLSREGSENRDACCLKAISRGIGAEARQA
jgi:tRNA A-37 threonylcarbamoyl transferase component Bud32